MILSLEWLSAPAALAVVFTCANQVLYNEVNDSPLNSVYSIFVAVWAALFVIFFKRRQRGLYIEWENNTNTQEDDDVRKEFEGTLYVNPVTDRLEPSFKFNERLIRYFQSFMMCLPYFVVVVVFNIIFLNLTGVIDPLRHHALFQIEPLSVLCQPGALFDPNSNAALIPTAV